MTSDFAEKNLYCHVGLSYYRMFTPQMGAHGGGAAVVAGQLDAAGLADGLPGRRS